MVKDKHVVLIGHSPTLIKKPRDIDAYDVVVRHNFGYPRPEYAKFMGTRTDIWFSWDGCDNIYAEISPKMNAKQRVRFEDYPREMFNKLRQEQGQSKAPSMGFLSYYYLLQQKPKSISLYGYDFFKSYDVFTEEPCEHNQINACHDFVKEEEWFWRTKPDFVKFYDENNREVKMNSKTAKRISNKAILEPKHEKSVKCAICGCINVGRTRCNNCNTELNG